MTASKRFDAYTERLAAALGNDDHEAPFRHSRTGLLLPLERKSIEPIAARVDPAQVNATRQSPHHFMAKSGLDHQRLISEADRRLSEKGRALAWRGSPILQATGQAGHRW